MTDTTLHLKTIVITGATSGIGLEAARALVSRGADVIGVGRSAARCQEARQAILREFPEGRLQYCQADLSSLKQVLKLADELGEISLQRSGRLDVLVNNAAAVANSYTVTEDGYELQFTVNHLAPFLLTCRLLPLLQAAPQARVITVSSASHFNGRIHWDDIMLRRGYHALRAYAQSKLANVLFTYELYRRYGDPLSFNAFAVHPGLVDTALGSKGTTGPVRWFWEWWRKQGLTPAEGARTIVHLAAEPGATSEMGLYWQRQRPAAPSKAAQDPAAAARLWALSEKLCGLGA
jgi:NAD(P)-dependent dehydrogenase (short-subunit alcohol dehydrogenase family)